MKFLRASAALPQELVELSAGKRIKDMPREDILAYLMKYRPSEANLVIAHLKRAIWKAEQLHEEMKRVGLEYFNGDDLYRDFFILHVPEWKTILETASQLFLGMKREEEERYGSDIALLRKPKGGTKGEREQELRKAALALKSRLNGLGPNVEGLLADVKLKESTLWRSAKTGKEMKNAAEEALKHAGQAKALRAEFLEIIEKAGELRLLGRELQSVWGASLGSNAPVLMADSLERDARSLELKAEKAEGLCGVEPYPTIGAQRYIPVEIGGQKGYIDKKKGLLITENEEDAREFKRLSKKFFGKIEAGKKRLLLTPDELWEFVPLLPKLDAILKTVKIWKEQGYQKGMMTNIEINILFAGLDLTIMSKVPTTTAARVTGRELASSIGSEAGNLAMTSVERRAFMTAFDLKEAEFYNLWRIARPPSGSGLGWGRACRELAEMAGAREITPALMRKYVLRQTGENYLVKKAWVLRKGTADFVSESLSITSRKRFRGRVLAEIANELKSTIHHESGQRLKQLLDASSLTWGERKTAQDAFFLTFTSFSPKAQKALLARVEKRGWPEIAGRIRKDVEMAQREGVKDYVRVGTQRGLGRLVPEYNAALGYEALARHMFSSSAMYFVVAPVVWTNALNVLGTLMPKEYVAMPPPPKPEEINPFDRELGVLDERARRAAEARAKRRPQK